MNRGFACIGLDNPKTPHNVGSIMRAAGCYGAKSVFYTGRRFKKSKVLLTDPQKYHKLIPLIGVDELKSVIPFGCIPVAVDLVPGAISLVEYKHPERVFYIFGAEDGILGQRILSWCRDIIYIPTDKCMNLAATVNVILYDRMAKGL